MTSSIRVGARRWVASCVLGLLALSTSACVRTQLEFDRMIDTAYPATQTVGGVPVTLRSIYSDAGKTLIVNYDTDDIQPLSLFEPNRPPYIRSPQMCITNAELDAVMAANRSSSTEPTTRWPLRGATYHLYGVVVGHFGSNSTTNACDLTLLGRMWRTTDRSGFAMFYRNPIVSADNRRYLRSVAHEIGHAFNLHHQDGDGATTIMNQTGVVGSNYTYTFSAQSQTHLDDHPDECKYPGVGVFGDVDAAHVNHVGTTVVAAC